MNRKQDQLTTVQAAAFIINYMLGAGILTLPRTTVTAAGTPDVWISIILSGLLVMVMGIILVTLCRRFPGRRYSSSLRKLQASGSLIFWE